MKKILIGFSLFLGLLSTGCSKNDGPVRDDILIDAVPQPVVIRNGGSTSISVGNLAAFSGVFDVKLLYPNDIQPAKMDVVIRKNSSNSNVKVFKDAVTTFPSTFTINAAQITALFGAAIVAGDKYEIGVDIYIQNGKKFEAFPAVGVAYGSTGVANQPGFSVIVTYSAS